MLPRRERCLFSPRCPHSQRTSPRLHGSRGISRQEGGRKGARAGGIRSSYRTGAGADQCPGQVVVESGREPYGLQDLGRDEQQRESRGGAACLAPFFRPLPWDRECISASSTSRTQATGVAPSLPARVSQPAAEVRARVLTSALTSASSAAAPRPRQLRSTSSSGSSRGRSAASRPPRRLPAQDGRPGALRSLPMLSAPSPARRAARGARPLAGAVSPH